MTFKQKKSIVGFCVILVCFIAITVWQAVRVKREESVDIDVSSSYSETGDIIIISNQDEANKYLSDTFVDVSGVDVAIEGESASEFVK